MTQEQDGLYDCGKPESMADPQEMSFSTVQFLCQYADI